MKFSIGLVLCFLSSAAVAQVVGDGMGSPYGGNKAVATYTGPGDVVSGATAWYGLRAYNAAYATAKSKAVNLRRASDNATCDFDVATTGALGVSDSGCGTGVGLSLAAFATQDATCTGTIASTTLTCASASSTPHTGSTLTGTGITQPSYIVSCGTFTAGTGTCTLNTAQTVSVGETITMTYGLYITEAYDQSGSNSCTSAPCNATQATAGNQPQLLPSCVSGNPCINFIGSSSQSLASSAFVAPTPLSIYTVLNIQSTPTGTHAGIGALNGTNASILSASTTANDCQAGGVGGGSIIATGCNNSTWNSVQAVYNGASSSLVVDSVATVGSLPTNGGSGFTLGSGGNFYTGYVTQEGLWSSAFNSTQYGNLCHNDYIYYGSLFSPSC